MNTAHSHAPSASPAPQPRPASPPVPRVSFAAPGRDQVALTLLAFALAYAGAIFWPLLTANLIFERTHATAWAMTVLMTPALYLFTRDYGHRPLGAWWRLSWTAAFVMAMIHFAYGLGEMHRWDAGSVFVRQGPMLAATIFGLLAVWAIDLLNVWIPHPLDWFRRLMNRVAYWWAVVATFVSTVLFNNDLPSLIVGLVMTGALLLGMSHRMSGLDSWRAGFASWVAPATIACLLLLTTIAGPMFLTEDGTDPAQVAGMQARLSIIPVLVLGGIAAALFLAQAPGAHRAWGWAHWQVWGAVTYVAHVAVGYLLVFGSFAPMLAQQGWIVLGANIALLALWCLSAVVAMASTRGGALHALTTVVFMGVTLVSTLSKTTFSLWVGIGLVLLWATVGITRYLRER